jgi:hypothetical protein
VLADARVHWFGVRHYSVACAVQVDRLIRETRPAAVLVEAPDDAQPLVPWVVHPDTEPPITLLSSYVDKKNRFGANGRLSPGADVPARYRGWWPLVRYCPEYTALRAGADVGAELRLIDAPLIATIAHEQLPRHRTSKAIGDRRRAEAHWFDTVARRQGHPTWDAWWEARIETPGLELTTERFQRTILTFTAFARELGGDGAALETDGTLLREQHMRWHIDAALRAHPDRPIVVVTGAFHTVELPWTKRKRAKAPRDAGRHTLLTAHSYRALARLYDQNRLPAWSRAVWEAHAAGAERPWDEAALQMLAVMRRAASDDGAPVSPADTQAAWVAARGLSRLRGAAQCTVDDVLDAVRSTFVKGDMALHGPAVLAAAHRVLVGDATGTVAAGAGQLPLRDDFIALARSHRIDTSGATKTVRCDIGRKPAHRHRSAFLHRCEALELPLFVPLQTTRRDAEAHHFKGPDPIAGRDLHLLGETWGIRWTEGVDDRLLEMSDRGTSLEEVAGSLIADTLATVTDDAAVAVRALLRCARMRLADRFDDALATVDAVVQADGSPTRLVRALTDFVLLHSYREGVGASDGRLAASIVHLYTRTALALPPLRYTPDDQVLEVVEHLQTLARLATTFEAVPLDTGLLVRQVRELVGPVDGRPAVRGAGFGVLHALGAVTATDVADELDRMLRGGPERIRDAGVFLDGLFAVSRSVFLDDPTLLGAVERCLARLEWDAFKLLLPDLRRAFARFIPAELDQIGTRVAERIGRREPPDDGPPALGTTETVRALDDRAAAVLSQWGL